MWTIRVDGLGRKFNRRWVFRGMSFAMQSGQSYALLGANGSGKSTLLQIIAGVLPTTEGTVTYHRGDQVVPADDVFRHLAVAAPYLELIEEFTLLELLRFHARFKPLRLPLEECLERLYLTEARHVPVRYLSSGMKQRLKLGLAFFSAAPLLLLDEPTSNLDARGVAWYHEHVQSECRDRLLILCSNQPHEYDFCPNLIYLPGQ